MIKKVQTPFSKIKNKNKILVQMFNLGRLDGPFFSFGLDPAYISLGYKSAKVDPRAHWAEESLQLFCCLQSFSNDLSQELFFFICCAKISIVSYSW